MNKPPQEKSQGLLPSQIAVVGLGYVGLPLAYAFAKVVPTIGFDVDSARVGEMQAGHLHNGQVRGHDLRVSGLRFTDDPTSLRQVPFIVVAVPTPVDAAKRPDLSHLIEASRSVGRNLGSGTVVVYESTVYPGCTEEVCVPVLERESGLKAGTDFKVGYSPERINPGDPDHALKKVVKVIAGQDEQTTELMASVYGAVVEAGVHRAPNIRTAEAAKVIENVQRDINIALMNEMAVLFHRLGIDTRAVLEAASTKWNFLPFTPGLVGGHCIPVDPYYLTNKAQEVGYHPEMILAGRRINDGMGVYVARETVRLLIRAGKAVQGTRVLVLGASFKEDVNDLRNSRVIDLVEELKAHGCDVLVHDPIVSPEALSFVGLTAVADPFDASLGGQEPYDALVLAVPHRSFRARTLDDYLSILKDDGCPKVLVDVKGVLAERANGDKRILHWSL